MNLATLRTRVASATGLTNSGTEQSLIDSWLNEAILQFLADTKMVKKTTAISATSGVGDYTLDYNVLSFEDVWYAPASGAQQVLMEPVDSRDIRQMRLYSTATPNAPYYYAFEGTNMFMIYPNAASSSDIIHMIYVATANSALSATADDPSQANYGWIPSEFHPILEAYAKWKAAEYNDNLWGQQWAQEYQEGITRAKSLTSRKSGTMLPVATWGRKSKRRYPTTPGTDTGV